MTASAVQNLGNNQLKPLNNVFGNTNMVGCIHNKCVSKPEDFTLMSVHKNDHRIGFVHQDSTNCNFKGEIPKNEGDLLNQKAKNNHMVGNSPITTTGNFTKSLANQLNQVAENNDMISSPFFSMSENVNQIPIDQLNQEAENYNIIVLKHQETNHFNNTADSKENLLYELNQEVENIDRVNYDHNDYNNLMSTPENFPRNPIDELIQEFKNNDFFVFDYQEPKNVNSTAENQFVKINKLNQTVKNTEMVSFVQHECSQTRNSRNLKNVKHITYFKQFTRIARNLSFTGVSFLFFIKETSDKRLYVYNIKQVLDCLTVEQRTKYNIKEFLQTLSAYSYSGKCYTIEEARRDDAPKIMEYFKLFVINNRKTIGS